MASPVSAAPGAGAHRPGDARDFCYAMLPKVSRTFAICIRLLPRELEYPVLVAYLLCRIADTIEDSTRLTADAKVRLLARFRDGLNPNGSALDPLVEAFAAPIRDEERLAHHAPLVLAEFLALPAAQRDAIRPWVREMCDGMAEFVARGRTPGGGLEALATVEELDRYCYFVAGTVGHLLTALFQLHSRLGNTRRGGLEELAASFGLGLQLTNIVKDVADDRRRGWSFVPRQLCQLAGISPEELHEGTHRDQARHVMHLLIEKAKGHLLDALEYSTRLPRRAYGIRLFCLTSLYFAVRTLRLAEGDPRLLDPHHKVKITRGQVWRTVAMTRVLAPINVFVRAYFRWLAGRDWWGRPAAFPLTA